MCPNTREKNSFYRWGVYLNCSIETCVKGGPDPKDQWNPMSLNRMAYTCGRVARNPMSLNKAHLMVEKYLEKSLYKMSQYFYWSIGYLIFYFLSSFFSLGFFSFFSIGLVVCVPRNPPTADCRRYLLVWRVYR